MADDAKHDYHADLGLKAGATISEIKAAFYALAKQHHPDKTGATDSTTFRTAREAFEKLTDAESRAKYECDRRFQTRRPGTDVGVEEEDSYGPTRTEQFAAWEETLRRSPPPYKPKRGAQEPGWAYFYGRAFTAWVKRDKAWRARHPEPEGYSEQSQSANMSTCRAAHGLRVQMSDHPATSEICSSTTQNWRVQIGGQDMCIFCAVMHTGCSRCPACQALACPSCLRETSVKERAARPPWTSGFSYRPSEG
ncbi:DnaJ-domain-containing protein [Plenodomus tracheiphilus IPT5]|uniref:DnaJ-domain-containing protein n=1 Tax=Plenodomus tracheiphilus IPT5 TaxID=1408161 RepID=A0A6A7B6Y7_9PLEO|nr:DnaJ-domain-containing protein [Plenodomus tracheiphilus IPT5]